MASTDYASTSLADTSSPFSTTSTTKPTTPGAGLVTPTVLSSTAATKDLQTKITPGYQDALKGITDQALKIKATLDAKAAQESSDKTAADAKAAADAEAARKQQETNAKTAAVSGAPVPDTTTTPPIPAKTQDQLDLEQAQKDYQVEAQHVHDTIDNIQNGTIPLSAGEQAQVEGLKQQFGVLIDQQKLANEGASGLANIRGYQKGAAEYDPTFQTKTIGSIVTAGLNKIADLNIKMASAVATLTQSFKDNDIKAVKDAWDIYTSASKERTDALKETIKSTQDAIKEANDKIQKAKDDFYTQVTKPISDIALEAAKNGADDATKAKIAAAKTVQEAMAAAGDYLQTGTGDLALYLQYKRDALSSGQSPVDFMAWQAKQAAATNKAEYSKAYAQAAGKAAGEASVAPPVSTDTPLGALGGGTGGSILSQAGLSIAAFNFLTQGTPSMSRMPASQRTQIMNEAQKWLNKNGIDISTFQSQYKTYNDVLSSNIERMNKTKIMENEIQGTLTNLNTVANNAELGKLKWGNVAKLWTGGQVNDPLAQKYAFHLQQLKNEMAGYFAASQGKSSPDVVDNNDAEMAIKNGINQGTITALNEAVKASTVKMAGVLQNSVNSSRKAVWDLFGVGDKFKPGELTADKLTPDEQLHQEEDSATTAIAKFQGESAQNADRIKQLHQLAPDATASEIAKQLGIDISK